MSPFADPLTVICRRAFRGCKLAVVAGPRYFAVWVASDRCPRVDQKLGRGPGKGQIFHSSCDRCSITMAAVLFAEDHREQHGTCQEEAQKNEQKLPSHEWLPGCQCEILLPEIITNMPNVFLWAHRGVSLRAPENTMAAFAAARDCQADGIELDIHLSADGVPVVMHDETLDRTTDGQGPIGVQTVRQLQRLDAGSWFAGTFAGETVPLLDDVLKTFGDTLRLNLEIKDLQAGAAVLALLETYRQADCLISSFDYPLLARLRAWQPSLPLAVLFDAGNWHQALRFAVGLHARAFHPGVDVVTRPMIAACRRARLPVHVWTVDDPAVARSLVRAGVSGLFSNDPAALNFLSVPH